MNPSEKSAAWIAKAMKLAGISQKELARRMGVAPSSVCTILSGKHRMRVDTLFRMIEACGFEIQELRAKKKAA